LFVVIELDTTAACTRHEHSITPAQRRLRTCIAHQEASNSMATGKPGCVKQTRRCAAMQDSPAARLRTGCLQIGPAAAHPAAASKQHTLQRTGRTLWREASIGAVGEGTDAAAPFTAASRAAIAACTRALTSAIIACRHRGARRQLAWDQSTEKP
jgi:hypothetical protein